VSVKSISQKDWKHVKCVWELFNVKNMVEFHDIYGPSDTHKVTIKMYGLEITHYFNLRMLPFETCLKHTRVTSDYKKRLEEGNRGGISNLGETKEATFDQHKQTSFLTSTQTCMAAPCVNLFQFHNLNKCKCKY
jgi:hypothetical protein